MTVPPSAGPSPRLRLVVIALVALLAALIVGGVVLWFNPPAALRQPDAASAPGVMRLPAGSELGGPFALVDQDNRPVTEATFAGKFMLIYFGFTYCPDVCPTELQAMATALDDLGGEADKVQPMLISVDPARDTAAQLKSYVAAFHPRMIGLTGSEDEVAAAAKAYRVYYAKAPADADGNYNVDHTSFVYLMGPDGKLRSVFRGGTAPESMAAEMRAQMAR